jgi:hypothetical protein
VRFRTRDVGADGRERVVELHRERVIVRRAVAGIRMAVSLPVDQFLGVALRVISPGRADLGGVAVVLEHRDGALAVPLYTAPDSTDVLAEWQAWARVLGLPMLVRDDDGSLHEPFPHLGRVRVFEVSPRRRRASALKRRRALILMRRKPGRITENTAVHRDEREIIARD